MWAVLVLGVLFMIGGGFAFAAFLISKEDVDGTQS